jgi:hypothetical protein
MVVKGNRQTCRCDRLPKPIETFCGKYEDDDDDE